MNDRKPHRPLPDSPNRSGGVEQSEREPWEPPTLSEMPPLTELTLTTGSPIGGSGDTSGGGSTVF